MLWRLGLRTHLLAWWTQKSSPGCCYGRRYIVAQAQADSVWRCLLSSQPGWLDSLFFTLLAALPAYSPKSLFWTVFDVPLKTVEFFKCSSNTVSMEAIRSTNSRNIPVFLDLSRSSCPCIANSKAPQNLIQSISFDKISLILMDPWSRELQLPTWTKYPAGNLFRGHSFLEFSNRSWGLHCWTKVITEHNNWESHSIKYQCLINNWLQENKSFFVLFLTVKHSVSLMKAFPNMFPSPVVPPKKLGHASEASHPWGKKINMSKNFHITLPYNTKSALWYLFFFLCVSAYRRPQHPRQDDSPARS